MEQFEIQVLFGVRKYDGRQDWQLVGDRHCRHGETQGRHD